MDQQVFFTQAATILLAPQRMGYGVCGMVPPQLFVTTSSNLSITSIADYGAIPGFGSVADVPCPGAPSVRGWLMRLVGDCSTRGNCSVSTYRVCLSTDQTCYHGSAVLPYI